jgi:hypothetical protein
MLPPLLAAVIVNLKLEVRDTLHPSDIQLLFPFGENLGGAADDARLLSQLQARRQGWVRHKQDRFAP